MLHSLLRTVLLGLLLTPLHVRPGAAQDPLDRPPGQPLSRPEVLRLWADILRQDQHLDPDLRRTQATSVEGWRVHLDPQRKHRGVLLRITRTREGMPLCARAGCPWVLYEITPAGPVLRGDFGSQLYVRPTRRVQGGYDELLGVSHASAAHAYHQTFHMAGGQYRSVACTLMGPGVEQRRLTSDCADP